MAVTSEVEIVNSALNKIGAERINALTDENSRARLCANQYPIVRDALVRSHPWNFAIAYASLAEVTPTPSEVFDYGAVFDLPSDCARVLSTDLGDEAKWEVVDQNYLACNATSVRIKYIKRVKDVTKFDDNFIEALAYALAADIAFPLTKNVSLQERMVKMASDVLRPTRSYDAQVGSVRRVVADTFITSRRGGRSVR